MGLQNDAWNQLNAMAEKLMARIEARRDALAEAARQRPDLAAVAIGPDGKPVRLAARKATAAAKPLTVKPVEPPRNKLLEEVDRIAAQHRRR
jgi:hypothetical protein